MLVHERHFAFDFHLTQSEESLGGAMFTHTSFLPAHCILTYSWTLKVSIPYVFLLLQ